MTACSHHCLHSWHTNTCRTHTHTHTRMQNNVNLNSNPQTRMACNSASAQLFT